MRAIDFGPVTWRKSSYSTDQANCVEVRLGQVVGVRDSKDPESGVLAFSAGAWQAARLRF
jgi:hypothetical protein